MKQFFCTVLLLILTCSVYAQHVYPILKTTSNEISIRDGNILRTDYWSISPSTNFDVYIADKTSQTKYVTFISDIDSIQFLIKPLDSIGFFIVMNDTEVCPTQLNSGMTYKHAPLDETPLDTIPFDFTSYNNISTRAVLNEVDTLNLMFHTGESSVGITFDALEKLSRLDSTTTITAGSWGGGGEIKYTKNNKLKIGKQEWDKMVLWINRHSGHFTDGKYGPLLFNDRIIEIDFNLNEMRSYSNLKQIDFLESYSKYPFFFDRGLMFVHAKLKINDNSYHNKFMIHSGYSGALLLNDAFASQHKIGDQLKVTSESQLKDSFGNVLLTKKAVLPELEFGGEEFTSIPISFFEGKIGNQKYSVLGGELLKRFNIIFDLQRAELYLKPNGLMGLPFPKDVVKG